VYLLLGVEKRACPGKRQGGARRLPQDAVDSLIEEA
jgi:hypothetical protein